MSFCCLLLVVNQPPPAGKINKLASGGLNAGAAVLGSGADMTKGLVVGLGQAGLDSVAGLKDNLLGPEEETEVGGVAHLLFAEADDFSTDDEEDLHNVH